MALNLALVTRYADLTGRLPQEPQVIPRPLSSEPPFGS